MMFLIFQFSIGIDDYRTEQYSNVFHLVRLQQQRNCNKYHALNGRFLYLTLAYPSLSGPLTEKKIVDQSLTCINDIFNVIRDNILDLGWLVKVLISNFISNSVNFSNLIWTFIAFSPDKVGVEFRQLLVLQGFTGEVYQILPHHFKPTFLMKSR